jgi:hypothetical protein
MAVAAGPEKADVVEEVEVDRLAYAMGGTVLGGSALLLIMPPGSGAHYPPCPFLLATGMDCPFCGGLRGTYSLLHGDLAGAFDHNILVPFLAVGFVIGALTWAFRRVKSGPVVIRWSRITQRWVLGSAMVLLAIFWVVRNLPMFPYLDSGA